MPELPEVQTVVDSLAPRWTGRAVASVRFGPHADHVVRPSAAGFAECVVGRTVGRVRRRGKRIEVDLTDGDTPAGTFVVHLGMTGRLLATDAAAGELPHTHVAFVDGDGGEVRFVDPRRFGGVVWAGLTGDVASGRFSGAIGPEPLTIRPAALLRRLSATRRPVKNALLDQAVVAGLGNIYVDESLHAAGVHPLTPARDLGEADVRRLNRAIKSTLRRAIRHRGSTLRDYVDADGVGGGFQRLHKVYARAGEPCRACGATIERVVLAGRSTHFCPACQPARLVRVAAST